MTKEELTTSQPTQQSAEQNAERRSAMLAAIRDHLAASKPFDAVRDEHRPHDFGTQTSRGNSVRAQPGTPPLVGRFKEALESVSGHCVVVPTETEAAEAIQRIIHLTIPQRIAVSNSLMVNRILEQVKSEAVLLEDVAPPALFDCDMGITSAQWAIAETGTLVLESEKERHRLVSLVPPVHVAIIEASRILSTMNELLDSINQKGAPGLSRTVTFITGPSRTSDIELTLAIGVHGPGELHVIVIDDVQETV